MKLRTSQYDGDETVVPMANELAWMGMTMITWMITNMMSMGSNMRMINEELIAKLEVITAKSHAFDVANALETYYQDSDNANSPLSSEEDDGEGRNKNGKNNTLDATQTHQKREWFWK